MHNSSQRARGEGFTLIELILTIAIVVLLALILVPKLMNATPRIAVESEGIRLRADIGYTQQLAIATVKPHRLVFDSGSARVVIQCWNEGAYVPVSQRDLDRGVGLAANTFADDALVFDILGAPSEGGNVVLRGPDGSTVTLTVSPGTGFVTVDSGGKSL